MADNNGGQRESVTAALRRVDAQAQQVKSAAASVAEGIMAQADALAQDVTSLGNYAREHGQYIEQQCLEYAKQHRANAAAFARELLASEDRRRGEIAKLLGQMGK